ncbi:Insulin-like growth factor-binding protein complex acid labile subunit [Anthophora plagiata]
MTSVKIPAESFPRLSILYLSDNNIKHIDPFIFQDHLELKIVHLEGNNIETLNLKDIWNLEELYLDRNPIQNLVIDSFNQSLKVLSLSDCFLKQPIYISSPLLITLDMSRNQISDIYYDVFKSIPLLENLNLMYNNIMFVPDLKYLKHLKRLFLDNNNISMLQRNFMPDSLKTLSLKRNQIDEIDKATFANLELLEELDLSFNKLESLPIDWQVNLKMLRYLNLISNRFTMISDMEISRLTSLKELCVVNNFMGSIDLNSLQIVPQECTVYVLN